MSSEMDNIQEEKHESENKMNAKIKELHDR